MIKLTAQVLHKRTQAKCFFFTVPHFPYFSPFFSVLIFYNTDESKKFFQIRKKESKEHKKSIKKPVICNNKLRT